MRIGATSRSPCQARHCCTGRLQVLHHVEPASSRSTAWPKIAMKSAGLPAGGEVGRSEPRGFRDLRLAVAGIQEGAAKLHWRQGRFLAMRQAATWQDRPEGHPLRSEPYRFCEDAMRRTKAASAFPHSPSSITGNEGD
jgi:hypothetical protein